MVRGKKIQLKFHTRERQLGINDYRVHKTPNTFLEAMKIINVCLWFHWFISPADGSLISIRPLTES